MLALIIATGFVFAGLAAIISLTDSAMRARIAFADLQRERELARAGFVPMIESTENRLRRPHANRVGINRSFAQSQFQSQHPRQTPARDAAAA